jgi:hypothetical protein
MDLPLAVLIVVAAAAAGALMIALIRTRASGPLVVESTRGTPMTTVAGTSFAGLLAFVISSAFQTYNGAKTGAGSEAEAVLDMARNAAFFPALSVTSCARALSRSGMGRP